jgi:hypothetical protein
MSRQISSAGRSPAVSFVDPESRNEDESELVTFNGESDSVATAEAERGDATLQVAAL